MDNLEYIDNYFSSLPRLETKAEFEKKIQDDSFFAEEVAFYLAVKNAAKEASRERFKEMFTQFKQEKPAIEKPQSRVRKLWPYIAAAAMIAAVIFGLNTWLKPAPAKQLADKYVQEHFRTLSVTMSSKEDSLQTGLRLYNNGKPQQALLQFENIIHNDTLSFEAKKYAGIVALQLGQYDKALKYFEELENYPGLQINPGKFYHAITLMERGQSGDRELAKQLLNKVDQENLEGKKLAREWLKNF